MGAEQSHLSLEKLKDHDLQKDFVSFYVNGKEYTVKTNDPDIGPNYLLVDYLRDKLGLTGTKYMCREGGCGSCMVTLKSAHPNTGLEEIQSANSCLLRLFSCDGLDITTVEALGNKKDGYNAIQESLVKFGGTQCGFCTPGFVINMHSIALAKPKFTSEDVQRSFDGNICRCTGYRPIMDAFKALSVNPSEHLKQACGDIEDISQCPLKAKPNRKISDGSFELLHQPSRKLYLRSDSGQHWFKVTNVADLFEVIHGFIYSRVKYRLVAGNTGTGLYKNDGPYEGFIDINDIPDLSYSNLDQSGLVLGGGTTLTAAMEMFKKVSQTPGYSYAMPFYHHFEMISCHSIRNRGTLAGNLMLKHQHREFDSDVFLLLAGIGATLRIGSTTSLYENHTIMDFLQMDMTGKVILWVFLPPLPNKNFIFRSFKIGKRYQNTLAYVNAAFLFNIDARYNGYSIIGRPSICYGGINPDFVHAHETEDYLSGKPLTAATVQEAMGILKREAVPNIAPAQGTPEYRLGLAQSYLYKFILGIMGHTVTPTLQSGATDIDRTLKSGTQTFDSDQSKWPLNQPIPKLESFAQTSGEAEYINDIRAELDELFGVFVLTTVANATLKNVDASEALRQPDVVAFITAKDVPGANNHAMYLNNQEEIFISTKVKYAGQAVGLLVARSKYAAFGARSKVKVTYENVKKPILDIRQAPKTKSCKDEDINLAFPCRGFDAKTAKEILNNFKEAGAATSKDDQVSPGGRTAVKGKLITVEGELYLDRQYHFHMENQICLCVPKENGMDVFSSTQHMDGVQAAISAALSVPMNTVNVQVRRLGGSFGAKISKAAHIATACAVAAHVTNKPVRVALDLETNMNLIGKRLPYHVTYKADVDETGKIHGLKSDIICDTGAVSNEPTSLYAMICAQSCYRADGWNITPGSANTDTAPNTYCRSPGSTQGVAAIETIMDHIAFTLKIHPVEVRQVNFIQKGDPFIGIPGAKLVLDNLIPKMIKELNETADFQNRRKAVKSFNQTNRWKKRGISLVPQRYPNYYPNTRFPTHISVYAYDGTVNVSHAGIDMGQGLNTKVAQVVAHTLQIPLEKVRVQPSTSVVSPNAGITGGSVGSELTCAGAIRACQELLAKLAPIRKQLKDPTWEELVAAANAREILLTAQAQEIPANLTSYDIWGVTVVEVEVDVLTGDYKITRADILEDAGESLSPLVDIGQIEGAFIMGLGWWLTEELIYDQATGELLTDNTWTYKPMLPADIPDDFRITMLRNAPNPHGILSSKATGEPPFNMSVAAVLALRNAINSARKDAGNRSWYQMNGTITREVIRKLALTSTDQFTF